MNKKVSILLLSTLFGAQALNAVPGFGKKAETPAAAPKASRFAAYIPSESTVGEVTAGILTAAAANEVVRPAVGYIWNYFYPSTDKKADAKPANVKPAESKTWGETATNLWKSACEHKLAIAKGAALIVGTALWYKYASAGFLQAGFSALYGHALGAVTGSWNWLNHSDSNFAKASAVAAVGGAVAATPKALAMITDEPAEAKAPAGAELSSKTDNKKSETVKAPEAEEPKTAKVYTGKLRALIADYRIKASPALLAKIQTLDPEFKG